MIHPSQLEKKFGGEAEDCEVFWPPKKISDEYGHDPDYIKEVEPSKEQAHSYEISQDESLNLDPHMSKIKSCIVKKTPNRKSASGLKLEDIKVEEKKKFRSRNSNKDVTGDEKKKKRERRPRNPGEKPNKELFKKNKNKMGGKKRKTYCCTIF